MALIGRSLGREGPLARHVARRCNWEVGALPSCISAQEEIFAKSHVLLTSKRRQLPTVNRQYVAFTSTCRI